MNKAFNAAKIAVAGINWKNGAKAAHQYADAVGDLAVEQRRLVYEESKLGSARRGRVEAILKSEQKLRIEETLRDQGLRNRVVNEVSATLSTKELTRANINAALSSVEMSDAERVKIRELLLGKAALDSQSMSLKMFASNAALAVKAMLANPFTWVMAGVAAYSAINNAMDEYRRKQEEARQASKDQFKEAKEQSDQLSDLIEKYRGLTEKGGVESGKIDEVQSIQKQITDLVGEQHENLDLVNGDLNTQLEILRQIRLENAKANASDLKNEYTAAREDYQSGYRAVGSGTNILGSIDNQDAIDRVAHKIGFLEQSPYYETHFTDLFAGKDATAVLKAYEDLYQAITDDDSWRDTTFGVDPGTFVKEIQDKIEFYKGVVSQYTDSQDAYFQNQALVQFEQDMASGMIDSQEEFQTYLDQVNGAVYDLDGMEAPVEFNQALLELAKRFFPQFDAQSEKASNRMLYLTQRAEQLKAELRDMESHGGNVDLVNRDRVWVTDDNVDRVHGLGMRDTRVGDYMTVASRADTDRAGRTIVYTPILPNGEILDREELDAYVDELIGKAERGEGTYQSNDQKGILLGVFDDQDPYTGDFETQLHDRHQELYAIYDEMERLKELNPADKLPDLGGTLKEVAGIYEVISAAQGDMMREGSVSAETIDKLSGVTTEYSQYLYEENGAIRVNIEALRELAQSKYSPNIHALEEENTSLLRLREAVLNTADAKEQLSWIDQKLSENEQLISMYQSVRDPFQDTLDTFDNAQEALKSLAEVQKVVADGYTVTAAEARKLAGVYPELLSQATVLADGQMVLNQQVFDDTIAKKRGEVNADIEAEIQKLELRKTLLAQQIEMTDQQIALVEAGNAQELNAFAEMSAGKHMIYQAIVSSAKQAGIDEEKANLMAQSAMLGDWQNFEKLTKEALGDIDGEAANSFLNMISNSAAMANSLIQNNRALKDSYDALSNAIANVGKGIQTPDYYGRASVGGGINFRNGKDPGKDLAALLKEMHDNSYGDDGITDGEGIAQEQAKWKSKMQEIFNTYQSGISGQKLNELKAQRRAYLDEISGIQKSIDLLRAAQNTPLDVFADSKKGGGSGKGGSGASEVKEYIANIDRFAEALKRLEDAKRYHSELDYDIKHTDNLFEQLALQDMLADSIKSEQDALHNLNDERDKVITSGVDALRKQGFEVEYNADTNGLLIRNMEHLNELTAVSAGQYKSIGEATNALRKENEKLIKDITSLNKANQESSNTWWELKDAAGQAEEDIQEILKEIGKSASEAVDEIQSVYDTLHGAADEYADTGYIAIDTFQKIVDLGIEYTSYLSDENGELVINEESIRKVIAAKTEQMAVDSSLAYVAALRIAHEKQDAQELERLTNATHETTNATWGLVYANLASIGLTEQQYTAALHNINAIRSLAENAVQGIGKVSGNLKDELTDMKSGLDDVLKYVMEMIKQQIEDQVDALERAKEEYSKIVEQKKESLQLTKEENDYQKNISEKVKELAKLQSKADALALDGSREAMAKRAGILEKIDELQQEIESEQADRTLEKQEETLDKMDEAYSEQKDEEIKKLEETIGSYQKLYDKAIAYIESHWETLENELIQWNYEYGDDLTTTIESAWDNCLKAAQKYGDYVSAMGSIDADISHAGTGGGLVVGNSNQSGAPSNEDQIRAVVSEMRYYSGLWSPSNSETENSNLHKKVSALAGSLSRYGVGVTYNPAVGMWMITDDPANPGNVGRNIYDCYHIGGVVGGGSFRDNERLSLLKEKEWVLSEKMVENLRTQMDRIQTIRTEFAKTPRTFDGVDSSDRILARAGEVINNTDNSPVTITIGDTVIHGGDSGTVNRHMEISRKTVNDIARILGIKV